ncbi:uncharacterized protein JCM6883_006523 [Sporobolomyces salmoneus]|uniref:uncharacterized protein n=1 Tax=Sporobolomyces salmoneus TaxID=183962 RepID=UPI0031816A46
MPLWSTSSSSSSSRSPSYPSPSASSSGATPPNASSGTGSNPLPHLDRPSHSTTRSLSKLSISSSNTKGKQPQSHHGGGREEAEEEDDVWEDGSEDESTLKDKFTSATGPSALSPTLKSPSSIAGLGAGGGGGGGGWFASFTSPFASSSSSSSSPSTASPSTTTSGTGQGTSTGSKRNVIRRQPSAKDVALALNASSSAHKHSPSSTPASLSLPGVSEGGGTGLKRSGGSYIGKVNEVQKEADQLVQKQQEEERRNSGESNERGKGSEREEEEEEKEKRGMEGSEKEKLRKCIRKEVYELVKDPTSVLPRLRKEWLTRQPSSSSSTASTSHSPTRDRRSSLATLPDPEDEDDSPTPRISISSETSAGDDDDRPRGYVSLNASSFSSSTAKPIVDYQKEYVLPSSKAKEVVIEEEPGEVGRERRRRKKFLDVLQGINPDDPTPLDEEEKGGEEERTREEGETDLGELRKLSWGGVPKDLRGVVWMLLLGYLPSPFSRRASTLARKRQEYADAVKMAFSRGVKGLDGPIWHQISIDVPRTRPGVKLWMVEGTQRSLERILYVWAIRHPASGYVQGINDLVTPFFQVFLSLYINSDPESFDPSLLPPQVLEALEADSFWCLSKLLDGIQDNYIFAQPGITRAVKKMELLCKRVDAPLARHLESEGVEFIQFAFRWMNCLLMRELSVKNIVRMWDTYLAEGGDAFSEFHLYVCLSFLVKWSEQLRTMDFQSIIMFLQSLPTKDWTDSNTELLLSEAFMWSRTFEAR